MQPEELIGRKKKPEEDEEIPPTPAAYAMSRARRGKSKSIVMIINCQHGKATFHSVVDLEARIALRRGRQNIVKSISRHRKLVFDVGDDANGPQ